MPDEEPVAVDCVKGLCFQWPASTEAWEASFLLLLHLSRWNVPLQCWGGGFQNNLAYIPWITQWSMCIELNNDSTEKDELGWGISISPQWELIIIKAVTEREREKHYFDKSQPNKETIQRTKLFKYSHSRYNHSVCAQKLTFGSNSRVTQQSVIRISRKPQTLCWLPWQFLKV